MMGRLPQSDCEEALVMGELSLDGSVSHSRGVLPMTVVARQQGFKRIFVPQSDAAEAALIPDMEVIPVTTLSEQIPYEIDLNGDTSK
jgi:magnesium chelatase family protein